MSAHHQAVFLSGRVERHFNSPEHRAPQHDARIVAALRRAIATRVPAVICTTPVVAGAVRQMIEVWRLEFEVVSYDDIPSGDSVEPLATVDADVPAPAPEPAPPSQTWDGDSLDWSWG